METDWSLTVTRQFIFGFNASPFILNYVLRYHAKEYADDEFSKILKENLYIDNMLVTSNYLNFLKEVYTKPRID